MQFIATLFIAHCVDPGTIHVPHPYTEGKVTGNCKRGWGSEAEISERIGIHVMVVQDSNIFMMHLGSGTNFRHCVNPRSIKIKGYIKSNKHGSEGPTL